MEQASKKEYCRCLIEKLDGLTDRQIAVFLYRALGRKSANIAKKMQLSHSTIKGDMRAIDKALFLYKNHDDIMAFLIHEVFCED